MSTATAALPNRVVKRNGNLEDTIAFILAVIRDKSHQVAHIAADLYHADPIQASRKIHAWLLANFTYKLDPEGMELIRTPEASIAHRQLGIDCEDYTILTACLLKEMGHGGRAFLTIVDIAPVPGYEHIYLSLLPEGAATARTMQATQPSGVAVDMLLPFGKHPDYIQKSMQINILGGIDAFSSPFPGILAGMSQQDQRKAFWLQAADPAAQPYIATIMEHVLDVAPSGEIIWRRDAPVSAIEAMLSAALDAGDMHNTPAQLSGLRRKPKPVPVNPNAKPDAATAIKRGIARVSPILIAGRGAFILLVKLNAFHLASKMRLMFLDEDKARKAGLNMDAWRKAKAALPKLENTWLNLGGHMNNLKEAISKGSGVPAPRLGGEPITTTALVASAVPVLTVIGGVMAAVPWKELTSEKGEKLDSTDMVAAVKQFVKEKIETGGSTNQVEKEIENGLQDNGNTNNNNRPVEDKKDNTVYIVIGVTGGLLVIGGIAAAVMSGRKQKSK